MRCAPYVQQLAARAVERPPTARQAAVSGGNGGGPVPPPQNVDAEQSVLGAVLLSDTALPTLIDDERLEPDDFYRKGHARIYQAMLDLHALGEPIDPLTLAEHLKQAGELEAVGGRAAIDLSQAQSPPSPTSHSTRGSSATTRCFGAS
jgi:DnaB-like helicase N terminal domain